jgi:hypothetical protein
MTGAGDAKGGDGALRLQRNSRTAPYLGGPAFRLRLVSMG